ncbi:terminase [Peribacillus butanolivorans]|uniref:P27 family phage terminase small subunit n=1 Tax=Peribacillus butanolivorans TaxID=421767 RepID=UPI0006A6F0D4|nr:P27 family phage terminase small subunit [Peribacillus butanolivorans]KON68605.1 terminase [Peribacillus butanolivorans]
MAVKITVLKEQVMNKLNLDDLIQVKKVERYIDLVKSFRRVNKIIIKEGESVKTKNGSQSYTKTPLIGERNKINASLLSIEKSFGFEGEKEIKHSASDLI